MKKPAKKPDKLKLPITEMPMPQALVPEDMPPRPTSLQSIRTGALQAQANTSKIIAELESWAHEIEATIAFLKANKRAK